MFGLGMPELIIILLIGVLVFGAKRLPEVGRGLGRGIREFRKASSERTGSPEEEAEPEKPPTVDQMEAGSPDGEERKLVDSPAESPKN
jgi:TatA/E family protein of Tat protein translocase